MTDNLPPDWARDEAIKRLNAEMGRDFYGPSEGDNPVVIAMARLIAEHEQPRVESASASDAAASVQTHLEFRPDTNDKFDELVARFADGIVHAEMMGGKSIYIGFYWDDGRYCQLWLGSKKKLWVNHEHGAGEPPRYSAHGVDRKPWMPDYTKLASAIVMTGIAATAAEIAEQRK